MKKNTYGAIHNIIIEDDYLKIIWDEGFKVIDKKNKKFWIMPNRGIQVNHFLNANEHQFAFPIRKDDPIIPVNFKLYKEGRLQYKAILCSLGKEIGKFKFRLKLSKGKLVFRISEITEELPSLLFPFSFKCTSLVLPQYNGALLNIPYPFPLFLRTCSSGTLSMRWFGGTEGEYSYIAIFSDNPADAGVYINGFDIYPAWCKSKSKFAYPREITYEFVKGNYVKLAKIFRDFSKKKKMFISLREKLEKKPILSFFIGNPFVRINLAHTYREYHGHKFPAWLKPEDKNKVITFWKYSEVKKIIDYALSKNINPNILLSGWMHDGYDQNHPDIWPPEPKLGSINEFKSILKDKRVLVGLHDQYQDMNLWVDSFPEGIMIQKDGNLFKGWIWAGGQVFLICSKKSIKFASRNWQHMKNLGLRMIFIDTTTASGLYECYHPEHPIDRADDMQNKIELLKFFGNKNLIVGSEDGVDWAVPYLDYMEGIGQRDINPIKLQLGEQIPLFNLVYHDAVFATSRLSYIREKESLNTALRDILYGNLGRCSFGRGKSQGRLIQDFIYTLKKEPYKYVNEFHKRVALSEMVSHEFLIFPHLQRTVFSSGDAVVVNFSDKPLSYKGKGYPAKMYKIES